ncbi:NACHT domain-containing protein [Amycolatopsis kentuckyensis]|uniref:NACHT domain-containing protein n=1 Tax=Amycolatopsis kentuckyensis TaxID=218823 RepID=UPI0035636B38
MTAALGWWVIQLSVLGPGERSDASSYGQFILAAVGLVIIIGGWVWKVFTPVPQASPDELGDLLATAMRNQADKTAIERRLIQPAPLPVRWRRATGPVAGPVSALSATRTGLVFDPLPGLTRVTATRLREGSSEKLHSLYGGLPSGRLMIIGGPGTGKSSIAVLLQLEALRFREQARSEQRRLIPVPVLVTFRGWDPVSTPLRDWLATKLAEIPLFAGRDGMRNARRLLDARGVSFILDGLDEIPERLRPLALRALSEQATLRVVVLARDAELAASVQGWGLTGAAVIQLEPLSPTAVAEYLLRPFIRPIPSDWEPLADVVVSDPSAPVAEALSAPLWVSLVHDVYAPDGQVGELLDRSRFPTADAITAHLLDQAVSAAYRPRPGQTPPRYSADSAYQTLAYIAHRLNQAGTRDFAWWEVSRWIPGIARVAMNVAFGAIVGVALIALWLLAGFKVGILLLGLVFGIAVGLAVGIMGPVRPSKVKLSIRALIRYRPLSVGVFLALVFVTIGLAGDSGNDESVGTLIGGGGLVGVLIAAAAEAVLNFKEALESSGGRRRVRFALKSLIGSRSLLFGLAFGLVCGLAAGLSVAFGYVDVRELGPWPAYAALFALVLGVFSGISYGIVNSMLESGLGDTSYSDPVREWRNEAKLGVGFGLIMVLPMAVFVEPGYIWTTVMTGTSLGLLSGICVPQTANVFVCQVYLSARYDLPLRLIRFLEDARARHIIRTVGPIYQFRHATLQDRLAERFAGEPENRSATITPG